MVRQFLTLFAEKCPCPASIGLEILSIQLIIDVLKIHPVK
jgi:hypothetical protein